MKNKDLTNIYTSYLTEARRFPPTAVEGMNEFIGEIDDEKKEAVSYELLMDLVDIIDKSGCPKILFDTLHGALGISKADECVVSRAALKFSIPKMLYVILHEVAHQYQYTKHGEELAEGLYFNDTADLDCAHELLRIENIADRYAIRLARYLLVKHNIPFRALELNPVYKDVTPAYIASHIRTLKAQIKTSGLTNVHEINDLLYNVIKQEIAPTNYEAAEGPIEFPRKYEAKSGSSWWNQGANWDDITWVNKPKKKKKTKQKFSSNEGLTPKEMEEIEKELQQQQGFDLGDDIEFQ